MEERAAIVEQLRSATEEIEEAVERADTMVAAADIETSETRVVVAHEGSKEARTAIP